MSRRGKRKKSLVGWIPDHTSILDNFEWVENQYGVKEIQLPIIRQRDVWGDNTKVRITIQEL